ncbi:MAG: HAD-IIIA family hydrolase, partial [Deltaproteobacteria bacterium]
MKGGQEIIAVFMDRDGTICEEVGYLSSPAQIRLIPGAGEAIRLLNERGIKAVVITNQSGIARGFFSEERLDEIHRELFRQLRA